MGRLPMTLGIVCGFAAEARIARRISPLVALGWCNPGAAQDLLRQGATALLSFGVAGGLDPVLKSGDLILGTGLSAASALPSPDPDLLDRLKRVLPEARTGQILAAAEVIASPADKARHFSTRGARAVDMESGMVAWASLAAGVPYGILRAISDPAGHTLPPAALVGLQSDGSVALGPVLRSLAIDPRQLPSLLRTGRESGRAMKTLRRIAPTLQQLQLFADD